MYEIIVGFLSWKLFDFFLGKLTYPTKREKHIIFKRTFGRGYVSSQEGSLVLSITSRTTLLVDGFNPVEKY